MMLDDLRPAYLAIEPPGRRFVPVKRRHVDATLASTAKIGHAHVKDLQRLLIVVVVVCSLEFLGIATKRFVIKACIRQYDKLVVKKTFLVIDQLWLSTL